MVNETTCALSFHLTTTDNKYARWASNFPNGQLLFVDDRLWQNDGSILNHKFGCLF
jgi:hypothetical protein